MGLLFQQWYFADRFNQEIGINVSNCRYVLILPKTLKFDLEKDLQKTLKITKKPLQWFVLRFRQYDLRIEYGTIFTQKDIRAFGPVSEQVSAGIVGRLLCSKYPLSVTFVCCKQFAKELSLLSEGYQVESSDMLVDRLLKPAASISVET